MSWKGLILIAFAIFLFIIVHYQTNWVDEFGDIDTCCSGLCGRCPPSFWECSFMGTVAGIQITIGVALLVMGIVEFINNIKGKNLSKR